MADRVVLHVGAMKSGTSYLQSLLFDNRAALAARGVCVPGETGGDQIKAVRALIGGDADDRGPWTRMVAEVGRAAGPALISMEHLGPMRPARIRRVVADLAPARVEVVLTARDLNRTIVSMWQETIQNGRSWTWEEYVAGVRDDCPGATAGGFDRETAGGTFWRQQNLVRIAANWAAAISPDRFTLVTLPPPGAPPQTLVERMSEASGVPLQGLTATAANASLGLPSTLVLRQLNELLADPSSGQRVRPRLRKKTLAKAVLAARADRERALGLPVHDWVRDQASATVGGLRSSGIRLVGAWEDLDPVPVAGVESADITEAELLEASVHALAGLVAG